MALLDESEAEKTGIPHLKEDKVITLPQGYTAKTLILEEDKPFCFTDRAGRIWNTKIDLAIAKRIDSWDFKEVTELKFSILNPTEKFYPEVYTNIAFRAALIWCIVQDQVGRNMGHLLAAQNGDDWDTDREQAFFELEFIKGFDGNVILQSREALIASLADFTPAQKNALQSLQLRAQKAEILLEKKLEEVSIQVDTLVEKEITTELDRLMDEFKAGGNLSVSPGTISTQSSE